MSLAQEKMDVRAVLDGLNAVLSNQYRAVLDFTLFAGSTRGFAYQALSRELWTFAEAELADTRRIIEKMTALGGEPTTTVASSSRQQDPQKTVERLIDSESEGIDALKACIPHTGQEGRSEALEHLLEHIILRKQNQVDLLIRLRDAG
jgi:bacterioferritin (cytochrome b1)